MYTQHGAARQHGKHDYRTRYYAATASTHTHTHTLQQIDIEIDREDTDGSGVDTRLADSRQTDRQMIIQRL